MLRWRSLINVAESRLPSVILLEEGLASMTINHLYYRLEYLLHFLIPLDGLLVIVSLNYGFGNLLLLSAVITLGTLPILLTVSGLPVDDSLKRRKKELIGIITAITVSILFLLSVLNPEKLWEIWPSARRLTLIVFSSLMIIYSVMV